MRAASDILRSRWMTEDKATLHELADKYGVSAERIRQIEANAIKKLREAAWSRAGLATSVARPSEADSPERRRVHCG